MAFIARQVICLPISPFSISKYGFSSNTPTLVKPAPLTLLMYRSFVNALSIQLHQFSAFIEFTLPISISVTKSDIPSFKWANLVDYHI
jgi:hypothetical protein